MSVTFDNTTKTSSLKDENVEIPLLDVVDNVDELLPLGNTNNSKSSEDLDRIRNSFLMKEFKRSLKFFQFPLNLTQRLVSTNAESICKCYCKFKF